MANFPEKREMHDPREQAASLRHVSAGAVLLSERRERRIRFSLLSEGFFQGRLPRGGGRDLDAGNLAGPFRSGGVR